MGNPITFRVESSLGAVFISLLSFFFIGLLFISIKNFETETDVMDTTAGNNKVSNFSDPERVLMRDWILDNNVELPEGSGYKYLIRKYPDRPWLD
ncbi:MAG: hypothetical protein Q7S43_01605 [bacterium]|nr:hypothetical protein [bacterium]